MIATTYTSFLTPIITLFTTTISSLQILIKSSLSKHVFLALSTYTALVALQPRWDDVMRQRAGRRDNELAEALHAMRGVCLRSFPEFLADVKLAETLPLAPGGKPIEIGTGVAEVTIMVRNISISGPSPVILCDYHPLTAGDRLSGAATRGTRCCGSNASDAWRRQLANGCWWRRGR